jgi:hypothetical protein
MNSNAIARFVDQTPAGAQSDKDKVFYTNRCDGCRVTEFYAASTARLTPWTMSFTPCPPPKSKSWKAQPNENASFPNQKTLDTVLKWAHSATNRERLSKCL